MEKQGAIISIIDAYRARVAKVALFLLWVQIFSFIPLKLYTVLNNNNFVFHIASLLAISWVATWLMLMRPADARTHLVIATSLLATHIALSHQMATSSISNSHFPLYSTLVGVMFVAAFADFAILALAVTGVLLNLLLLYVTYPYLFKSGEVIVWNGVCIVLALLALCWVVIIIKGFLFRSQATIERLSTINLDMRSKSEALRLALRSAQAANSAKTEFLKKVSDELREPLQSIAHITSGVLMAFEKDTNYPQAKDHFETIDKGSAQLLSLLDDMLDLSNLENNSSIAPKPHDMEDTLRKILLQFSDRLKTKGITVRTEIEGTHSFEGDGEKMERVLAHLLSNAIKFSASGDTITITIRDDKLDSAPALRVSVIDQGIGIPEEEMTTIFRRFIQSSKTDDGSGSGTGGIGLSIVANIIALHRGKVWAENNQESGATFTFLIPKNQLLFFDI